MIYSIYRDTITYLSHANNDAARIGNIGDGFVVKIIGDHRDIVGFYSNNDTKIAEDPIRNGDCLEAYSIRNNYKSFYNRISPTLHLVSITHGTLRDNIYCYAIVGTKVYRSPSWRDTAPGNRDAWLARWDGYSGIFAWFGITYIELGSFSFDPATNIWTCNPGQNGVAEFQTKLLN